MRDLAQFDKQYRAALTQRVLEGPQLRGSPKLQKFLLYIVQCFERGAQDEATEQQIGIHVFGRPPGYNSNGDTIVRSQARLLRQKLDIYFISTDGKAELLILSIPKGQYLPDFRLREEPVAETDFRIVPSLSVAPSLSPESATTLDPQLPEPAATSGLPQRPEKAKVGIRPLPLALCALVSAVCCLLIGVAVERRLERPNASALDALWSPFWAPGEDTLVIYSNPLFQGNPVQGMHIIDPGAPTIGSSNQLLPTDETYTGTGEVSAIYEITKLFASHRVPFTLKRSRLVTWDDARSRNLVFVGASSQNTALRDLPALTEFSIGLDDQKHGFILNEHPQPGEPTRFPTQDPNQETALIAFIPGPEANRYIMIFSGLTTIGTQAAVEYACEPNNAAVLMKRAGATFGIALPFEAVVRVGVSKGVAVSTQLLLLHHR